ncbi:hypothetical protein FA15DRAFT_655502 [Coprinopsis marcescibilis]|uniref:Uncharacterized protein n=1 Tax=Coprinopsis marcescibilis TaxID=230819 RepID=A0A5C3KXG5_COPMA|nr:hypothetical protein FA15DRAFT_655502 [Coprinopsis marcescibilis]
MSFWWNRRAALGSIACTLSWRRLSRSYFCSKPGGDNIACRKMQFHECPFQGATNLDHVCGYQAFRLISKIWAAVRCPRTSVETTVDVGMSQLRSRRADSCGDAQSLESVQLIFEHIIPWLKGKHQTSRDPPTESKVLACKWIVTKKEQKDWLTVRDPSDTLVSLAPTLGAGAAAMRIIRS